MRYHRQVGKPLDTVLASIHRGFFVQLKNNYDLLLSQEADMLVTVQNVSYFEKWAAKFGGTTLYPGFAIAEAATPGFAVEKCVSIVHLQVCKCLVSVQMTRTTKHGPQLHLGLFKMVRWCNHCLG